MTGADQPQTAPEKALRKLKAFGPDGHKCKGRGLGECRCAESLLSIAKHLIPASTGRDSADHDHGGLVEGCCWLCQTTLDVCRSLTDYPCCWKCKQTDAATHAERDSR